MNIIFRFAFGFLLAFSFVASNSSLVFSSVDPDLSAAKANNAGGPILTGATFQWTITITNNQPDGASFTDGQDILRDQLPNGPTYGTPTAGNFNNIINSGNISCAIDLNNLLTCEASGAIVTIGNSPASFTVTFDVTPIEAGTLINPDSGVCRVDPDDVIAETNNFNNDCTPNPDSVTVNAAPDVRATKTNDVGGTLLLPQSFQWTIAVENVQTPGAQFTDGDRILVDDLPNGSTIYGDPVVQNVVDITNENNIDCAIANNVLTCTANGATVTINGPTGSFDIVFSVTPMGTGTLTNPNGGTCQADPDNLHMEGDEVNNDCSDAVTVLAPMNTLAAPITINLNSTFNVPFWCGERKEVFTMDGIEFTNLEVFETEIEMILPQRRILLIFPGPTTLANLVEMATLTEPSKFLTPGDMSIPFRTQLQSGKTIRKDCNDLKALPTRLDGAGDIDQVLGNLLAGIEYFHGIFTIEADTRDLKVFVTKIVRSWKCVDEGSGLDCLEGQMDTSRKEISSISTNVRRTVNHEVPQPPFAPIPAQALPSISNTDLSVKASTISNGRAIRFRTEGQAIRELDVEVYSLNGKKVFEGNSRANYLSWRMRDTQGRPVANGVYLYRISGRDVRGNVSRSEIKKIIVLR